MCELKFDMVTLVRVRRPRCSKASSFSTCCRAHCSRVRLHWSHEERRFQRERFVGRAWFILAASARTWRCVQRTEHNKGFGIQTKVKDRFLNQKRWTCWYSCRKKHASSDCYSQFSFTFLFVLVLKSFLSLLFTSSYAMEAFLNFFLYLLFIWFLVVC